MSALSSHKILLTGLPGCGKTTLIKKAVKSLDIKTFGFYTGEIRESGKRMGFAIETISEKPIKGILSHINIKSKFRVGKYGVDIESFDKIALPELETGLAENGLIIVDEIGKMELYSNRFKDMLLKIFDSPASLLATILYKSHPFCDKLKQLREVEVIAVNINNRNQLADRLISVFGK
jgi:nucleoside-triphosphatase